MTIHMPQPKIKASIKGSKFRLVKLTDLTLGTSLKLLPGDVRV